MSYGGWAPYVPVAQRRANAAREVERLRKKGLEIEPVEIHGRGITSTFWGGAWCRHLEKFSDYANRLPRGRTYVRNGSVCHLKISKGKIEAIVSGTELYNIKIKITALPVEKWSQLRSRCAGQIGSILELLQGYFSDKVMEVVTDQHSGLFPNPGEISLNCDCPDRARLCKHIAAVLYGVGTRLDTRPELLFLLRNVDHEELIATELDLQSVAVGKGRRRRLADADLSDVFGVDIEAPSDPKPGIGTSRKNAFRPTAAGVARLRRRLKLTIFQFAKVTGVSPATVKKWENGSGRLNLRQANLDALSQVNGLSAEEVEKKLIQ